MSDQPYIGLRPFKHDETDIFFGRKQHRNELIDRLGASHFLAVVGTSGCGKSSLVKTGLIAGLEAGYLAKASTHWRIVEMRPSNQPFQALAAQLFSELKDVLAAHYTVDSLRDTLKQGSLSLHELLAQHPLPNNAQLLIVCDQFEEIFRYFQQGASAEARNFVSLLLASSKPYPVSTTQHSDSVYVVITMRSDFLGDCAQFAGLAEAINQGLYLTPRLNAQQLRAAIEEPAFVFDGDIEPALITQLLEDAQTNQDQLPLLQHVLMRLWNLASNKTATLTLADYQTIGGLSDALSRHADEVYNQISKEQQRIAELLFRSLTERGDAQRDTRRPTPLAEIIELTASSHTEVVTVIDAFRQTGCCFLMPPINVALKADSIIDISHESLIRQWQRLKDWAADETESAKMYQRLEDRMIEWQKHKADFLQSSELTIFQQWWQDKQPTELWGKRYGEQFTLAVEFLTASQTAHHQKQEKAEQQAELTLQAISNLTYDLIDELMECVGTLPAIKKIIQTNLSLLEKIDTPQAIREKIVNFNRLAEVHLKLGDKHKALNLSKKALKISRKLAKQDPQDIQAQRDLSVSFERLADIYLQLGDKGKTLGCYQKTLNIREQLARKDSQDSKAQQDLLSIFQVLSLYFYGHKNYTEAAKIYARALAKFPNDLNFLSNDMELALVQNDDLRFQQRLKSILPLLKSDNHYYAIIPLCKLFIQFTTRLSSGY